MSGEDVDITIASVGSNETGWIIEIEVKGNKELNKKSKGSNDSDMGSPWRNHIIEEL